MDFLATLLAAPDNHGAGPELAHPRYPTYAIAGAILVLNAPGNDRHRPIRDQLITALRARQLTEERGWQPADLSYGGWGYFSGIPRKPSADANRADPMLSANLSATLFALGALRLAGVPGDDPALQKARVFVERCQNYRQTHGPSHSQRDGGFFFSPAVPDGNKAGPADGASDQYRSYGSMTADGVRALIRLGLPFDHPRVQAAARWLRTHYNPARNPGDFPANRVVRQESAFFYYSWSSAHALRALGQRRFAGAAGDIDWPEALARELLSRQRKDGSFANDYSEMREDDPLLATAFAMAALTVAQATLRSAYRSHSHDAPE